MKKVYTFLLASSACLFVCNVSFAQTTPSTPDRLNKAIYVEVFVYLFGIVVLVYVEY